MQKKLMKVLAYLGEDDSLAASSTIQKSERELEISNSDFGSSMQEVQSNHGLSTVPNSSFGSANSSAVNVQISPLKSLLAEP